MSGQAIKSSLPILGKDAEKYSTDIINAFTSLNIHACTLGSTGKKLPTEYSGDIDIAVELEFNDDNIEFIKNNIIYKLSLNKENTEINVLTGFKILSFGFVYKAYDALFPQTVQVDLMFTDDINYSKFMYHSPNYKNKESNFKGLYRTNLLCCLAGRSFNKLPDIDNSTGEILTYWKYTLTYDRGLVLTHKSYIGKYKLLKNPVTIKNDEKFITKDINEIIKIVLGEKATIDDANSFESLINFIFSDKYKFAENKKIIYNVISDFIEDKRHETKLLSIIKYINKVINNKPNEVTLYKDNLMKVICNNM